MEYDSVRDSLYAALEQHEELWEWIKRLDDGYGTYEEVNKIAGFLGDEVALAEYSEETFVALVKASHEIITMTGEVAQRNLNNAAGIGLKPLTRKYPEQRVNELVGELAGLDGDARKAELSRSVPTLMMGMVDDIVRYNMDFQAKAGLDPIIVRTWSGSYPSHDTKHTDWCHDLAGTYEYGKEPKNVYARHKGCRCKVEYFPNARAKGRITALSKGEVDVESVLWNTRDETLEKRLARAKKNSL